MHRARLTDRHLRYRQGPENGTISIKVPSHQGRNDEESCGGESGDNRGELFHIELGHDDVAKTVALSAGLELFDHLLVATDQDLGRAQNVLRCRAMLPGDCLGRRTTIVGNNDVADDDVELDLTEAVVGRISDSAGLPGGGNSGVVCIVLGAVGEGPGRDSDDVHLLPSNNENALAAPADHH